MITGGKLCAWRIRSNAVVDIEGFEVRVNTKLAKLPRRCDTFPSGLYIVFCLSIVMTTCSTMAALGMMPLLLFLYCHGFSDPSAVPFANIILAMFLTLVPCAIGIYLNCRVPQYCKLITRVRGKRWYAGGKES